MSILESGSFNPHEFFSFAASIVHDTNANESALRSAISRAYYSVYLVARDSLFGLDEMRLTAAIKKKIASKFNLRYKQRKRRDLGTHERVIFAILDKTHNITLSQQVDQLREARINADYKMSQKCLSDLGKQSWRQYAQETMQLGSLVLPTVKRLTPY